MLRFTIQDFRCSPAGLSAKWRRGGGLLHQNYVVTCSIWDKEDIIFNQVTEDWKLFC